MIKQISPKFGVVVSFVCYLSLLRNVRRSEVDIISRGSTVVTHFSH